VNDVLQSLQPAEMLACVGKALHAYSHKVEDSGKAEDFETPAIQNPLRISVQTPMHTVLFMPSRLGSQGTTSIKIVSVPRSSDDKRGLPASTLLIDEKTGQTKVVMNASCLTAVRTAAASALALSLSPTACRAQTLLIFGSGLQAQWHARLVTTLSPSLRVIVLACRNINERALALKNELRSAFEAKGIEIRLITDVAAIREGGVVEDADLICCCTPSTENLFSAARLKKGANVTLIGSYKPHMREVELAPLFRERSAEQDAESAIASKIIVDSRSACLEEAGELYQLREDLPETFGQDGDSRERLSELGELVNAEGLVEQGALQEGESCIFKCVGMGVMDSAISSLVLSRALEEKIGTRVDF